jgi:hypothetical protein
MCHQVYYKILFPITRSFAWKDKDKGYDKSSTDGGTSVDDGQAIVQSNTASQESTITTAGANSPVQNSGNQQITQTNTNNGGNARAG